MWQLLFGRAFSSAGSMVQVTAAGWYVLQQTGSATAVGVVAALAFAPAVLGAPVGGWIADRYDIQRAGALLRACEAIAPLVIGLLIWDGELSIPLLYALVFLGAIPSALSSPIAAIIVPLAAPASMRADVMAYSAISYNISKMIGPLFAGFLVTLISIGGAFVFNGITFLVCAWIYLRAELVDERKASKPEVGTSYLKNIRRGWTFEVVRVAFLGALVFFGLAAPVQQMLPPIAQSHDESIGLLGLMFTAIAVGGVVANPLVQRGLKRGWSRSFFMDLSVIVAGPALMMLGISHWLGMDLLLLAILGMAWEFAWLAGQLMLQLELPRDLTGHMLGLFYSVVTLGISGGAILMGWLFDVAGERWPLVFMGIFICLCGLFGLLRMRGHLRQARINNAESGG